MMALDLIPVEGSIPASTLSLHPPHLLLVTSFLQKEIQLVIR
jgi:hypothetical protein